MPSPLNSGNNYVGVTHQTQVPDSVRALTGPRVSVEPNPSRFEVLDEVDISTAARSASREALSRATNTNDTEFNANERAGAENAPRRAAVERENREAAFSEGALPRVRFRDIGNGEVQATVLEGNPPREVATVPPEEQLRFRDSFSRVLDSQNETPLGAQLNTFA